VWLRSLGGGLGYNAEGEDSEELSNWGGARKGRLLRVGERNPLEGKELTLAAEQGNEKRKSSIRLGTSEGGESRSSGEMGLPGWGVVKKKDRQKSVSSKKGGEVN